MQFFIVMLQINIYQENSLTIAVYYSSNILLPLFLLLVKKILFPLHWSSLIIQKMN